MQREEHFADRCGILNEQIAKAQNLYHRVNKESDTDQRRVRKDHEKILLVEEQIKKAAKLIKGEKQKQAKQNREYKDEPMKPDAKRDYKKLSKALELQIKELSTKHDQMHKDKAVEMTNQEKKLV